MSKSVEGTGRSQGRMAAFATRTRPGINTGETRNLWGERVFLDYSTAGLRSASLWTLAAKRIELREPNS